MNQRRTEKMKELISFGAEIAGGTAGGVVGFIVAGPAGGVWGAVTGSILTRSLEIVGDFALRDLSRREKIRAGAALTFTYAKIKEYLEQGLEPRDDGFFDRDVSGRSASDEILEGTLFKCRDEHEEKKLRLIGNIYANTAFMPSVSVPGATWLLHEVEHLTYRQLCIISITERAEDKGVSWGPHDGDPAFEIEYQQIDHMFARDHSPDSVRSYEETGEGLWVLGLSRIGRFVYDVMGLSEIPEADLRQLKRHFPRAF